jgi:hypothetical protein
MPATPKALQTHQGAQSKDDETTKLLQQIVAQQKQILATLEKLAAK